ncbi:MAG: CopG family transcriptional regulator [Aquiluna sp.]|jgi:metal-responsive CopG/Arc/MetJ family transcriptional regulator
METKRIDVTLPAALVASLDDEAQQRGMTRSELVKERLMSNAVSPNDFHKAVARIRRKVGSNLDARQMESIIAATYVEFSTAAR